SNAASGNVAPSDCDPNGGSAVAACVGTLAGKAMSTETKKCTQCPTCYGEANEDPNNAHSGDCTTDASVRTNDPNNLVSTEAVVDAEFEVVFCDSHATDPNQADQKAVFKCERGVFRAFSKLQAALSKCQSRCLSAAAKGTATGHCWP